MWFKILAFSQFFFVIGLAVNSVGTVHECTGEPYTLMLPLSMIVLMLSVALPAYFAGKEDGKNEA